MMRGIFVLLAWGLAFGEDSVSELSLRTAKSNPARASVLRTDVPQRALRICNAFVHQQPLKIRCLRTSEDLGTLAYKECQDHQLPLQEGDQIQFKADTADVGTFAVAGLPRSPVTLLLIVSNKKGHTTTAAFKSHAFADGADGTAQVAVVDTYQGTNITERTVRIRDEVKVDAEESARAGEELPLNSVVAVSPGNYRVELGGAEGPAVSFSALDAKEHVSYVVMRVGGEGGAPEEIVVFPQISCAARMLPVLSLFLGLAFFLQ